MRQDQDVRQEPAKRKKKKGGRLFYRIMAASFAGIVLLFALAGIVLPDRGYSEEEKRVLASFPEASWDGIQKKDYMEDLESYVSDQFVLRDAWIRFKVQCDLLVGKREFNGIYLGKDKYLIQIPEEHAGNQPVRGAVSGTSGLHDDCAERGLRDGRIFAERGAGT